MTRTEFSNSSSNRIAKMLAVDRYRLLRFSTDTICFEGKLGDVVLEGSLLERTLATRGLLLGASRLGFQIVPASVRPIGSAHPLPGVRRPLCLLLRIPSAHTCYCLAAYRRLYARTIYTARCGIAYPPQRAVGHSLILALLAVGPAVTCGSPRGVPHTLPH